MTCCLFLSVETFSYKKLNITGQSLNTMRKFALRMALKDNNDSNVSGYLCHLNETIVVGYKNL